MISLNDRVENIVRKGENAGGILQGGNSTPLSFHVELNS